MNYETDSDCHADRDLSGDESDSSSRSSKASYKTLFVSSLIHSTNKIQNEDSENEYIDMKIDSPILQDDLKSQNEAIQIAGIQETMSNRSEDEEDKMMPISIPCKSNNMEDLISLSQKDCNSSNSANKSISSSGPYSFQFKDSIKTKLCELEKIEKDEKIKSQFQSAFKDIQDFIDENDNLEDFNFEISESMRSLANHKKTSYSLGVYKKMGPGVFLFTTNDSSEVI